jgi:hypothetical protein
MKRILLLIAMFTLGAMAADISGTWKATADLGGQQIERTFIFKVDGTKLTGETTSSMMGKSTITDGKVEGDTLSFTITVNFNGEDTKLNYKGKVNPAGDQIRLTVDAAGNTIEWDAKKVS